MQLVSIITACRNEVASIESTILSVLNQSYTNIEYIVADGASTDGTLEVLKKYPRIKVLNGPDKGLWDAWNKGIQASGGGIIGLLNAGDVYDTTCVQDAVESIGTQPFTLSYGITRRFEKDITDWEPFGEKHNPDRLEYGFGFLHPSCFVTRDVYERIGLFTGEFSIAADHEFFFRCLRGGVNLKQSKNVVYMKRGGMSEQYKWKARKEHLILCRRYGSPMVNIALSALRFTLVQARDYVLR